MPLRAYVSLERALQTGSPDADIESHLPGAAFQELTDNIGG